MVFCGGILCDASARSLLVESLGGSCGAEGRSRVSCWEHGSPGRVWPRPDLRKNRVDTLPEDDGMSDIAFQSLSTLNTDSGPQSTL